MNQPHHVHETVQVEWCVDGRCFRLVGAGMTITEHDSSLEIRGPGSMRLDIPRVDFVHVAKL